MKSYAFLFWAYNVVWLCLSAWLLTVFLRVRAMDRRLAGLESTLGTDDDR